MTDFQTPEKPVLGQTRMIAGLEFDIMKLPAVEVNPLLATLAKTTHVQQFADGIARTGCCVSVPGEWGKFDTKSAADWANLPWKTFMQAQNDFLYAVVNFF